MPLTPQPDGTFTASFVADHDGFYKVEFDAPNGERVAASPHYTIDVLADQPPTVSFNRPGRDTSVSPIEEVFARSQRRGRLRRHQSRAGVLGERRTREGREAVQRHASGCPKSRPATRSISKSSSVQPGDAVSYYARATDNDAGAARSRRAATCISCASGRSRRTSVRRSRRAAVAAVVAAAAGRSRRSPSSSARSSPRPSTCSAIARRSTPRSCSQNSKVVALSQCELREQVEGLLTRINSELVERDPAFAKVAELLPQAVTAMKEAEGKLTTVAPDQALPPENKALQILQKAEEEYETQISVQRQQGGGGGGGGGAVQQELAELFEQELNQMASRYETAEPGVRAADRSPGRRAAREAEGAGATPGAGSRAAAAPRARGSAGGGGNSGAQQRALADQIEEAARRLERLAREEQRPELAESARQMREAADAMRTCGGGRRCQRVRRRPRRRSSDCARPRRSCSVR